MLSSYIFLSGGLGYIGSHIAVSLLSKGFSVIIADSLYNSKIEVLDKIKEIVGNDKYKNLIFYQYDLLSIDKCREIFEKHNISTIIHLAGLKAVYESIEKPILYYDVNINLCLNLLKIMEEKNINNFIFSSSATVYNDKNTVPFTESGERGATHAYGNSKIFQEIILENFQKAHPNKSITILRYFNPVGCHPSGLIGENPNGIPNNLMPYILKVVKGSLPKLSIFGNNYNTKDGTCVRDFIHVCDLAEGHVAALINQNICGLYIYNLGTGIGISVLDIVNEMNRITGGKVKYEFAPRREGDLPECYSNPSKAELDLGWKAKYGIKEMCEHSYLFCKLNL